MNFEPLVTSAHCLRPRRSVVRRTVDDDDDLQVLVGLERTRKQAVVDMVFDVLGDHHQSDQRPRRLLRPRYVGDAAKHIPIRKDMGGDNSALFTLEFIHLSGVDPYRLAHRQRLAVQRRASVHKARELHTPAIESR
ncbi:hypothetical protein D3C86_1525180 [compost metagenome]